MTYAKLTNGEIEIYSGLLKVEENIRQLGYKPVVFTKPEPPKWYVAYPQYTENETHIEQSWTYQKQPEPNWNEQTKQYIAERYTIEAEMALLRNPDPVKTKKHKSWGTYCKHRTKQDREEWESC
jgi:hypothetical protein